MKKLRHFFCDDSGNAALMFAILLVPVGIAIGAALDYSRAASARTAMQTAVDAATLAVARDGGILTDAEAKDLGRKVFDANFTARDDVQLDKVDVTRTGKTVTVAAKAQIKTTLMRLAGVQATELGAQAESGWGVKKVELALALDNTGSMAMSGKLAALKGAANNLLNVLEKSATDKDTFRVSIVPFTTQVNVGTVAKTASWLVFNLVELPILTLVDQAGWQGCVVDRDKPYDTDASAPFVGQVKSLYPAVKCAQPSLAEVMPLTSDYAALRARVNSMTAQGNTNVTIGLAWGLASLTPGAPLSTATAFGGATEKVMIVLTDGDNTQNRFTSNSNAIDARTDQACKEVKKANVRLYAVRVIDGNASLLRDCATTPSMYFDVKDASQLDPVFRAIAAEITSIRLTQ